MIQSRCPSEIYEAITIQQTLSLPVPISRNKIWVQHVFNISKKPITATSPYKETSQMICRTTQLAGFFLKGRDFQNYF